MNLQVRLMGPDGNQITTELCTLFFFFFKQQQLLQQSHVLTMKMCTEGTVSQDKGDVCWRNHSCKLLVFLFPLEFISLWTEIVKSEFTTQNSLYFY